MENCINFGINCVGCIRNCTYDRCCNGKCHACINNNCDNHPQKIELYGYAEELYA